MKLLITTITLLLSINASASLSKICVQEAKLYCMAQEFETIEQVQACMKEEMEFCLSSLAVNKSNPACLDECSLVQDNAQREMCYDTCSQR